MRGRRGFSVACVVSATIVVTAGFPAAPAAAAPTTWSVKATPLFPGGTTHWNDVSCVSTWCLLVGNFTPDGGLPARPASAIWDGHAWASKLALAIVAAPRSYNKVSCVTSTMCVAVGVRGVSGRYLPLAAKWNGRGWRQMTVRYSSTRVPQFTGVSCWATGCVASGWASVTGGRAPILERWVPGQGWHRETPVSVGDAAQLNDVACTSATDCTTVGDSVTQLGYATLVEHWNGTTWSVVTSPNIGFEYIDLNSVACTGAADCTAVGWWSLSTGPPTHLQGPAHTLVEHWDGSAWTVTTSPDDPTANESTLTQVSCTSVSDCVAVGAATSEDLTSRQTLAEVWDGSAWTIVAVPGTGDPTAVPFGASCGTASACLIVGFAVNGASQSSYAILGT